MLNILIVYYHRYSFPMRQSIKDHLYSFNNYFKKAYFFYLNAAFPLPFYIFYINFDLIIFHTTFLSRLKWSPLPYEKHIKKYKKLTKLKAPKVIIPQDEFIRSDVICNFIKDFDIKVVFTTSDKKEIEKIYPEIDKTKVKFVQVLTGYLDEYTIAKVKKMLRRYNKRPIDIGYRVTKVPFSLGKHGYEKEKIAHLFQKYGKKFGLKVDISTDEKDIFLGFDWYRFLLKCKYTIGVEGGSSILDFDGSIRKKVQKYLQEHPKANFKEVQKECLADVEGNLNLFAISPRHLEACMTKTCQILVEGNYNGILIPWRHYIPLKRDYSNIKEVIELVKKDLKRNEIVEQAYKDIVESGKYTYKEFVNKVIFTSLEDTLRNQKSTLSDIIFYILYILNKVREFVLWKLILIESVVIVVLEKLLGSKQLTKIKKMIRRED